MASPAGHTSVSHLQIMTLQQFLTFDIPITGSTAATPASTAATPAASDLLLIRKLQDELALIKTNSLRITIQCGELERENTRLKASEEQLTEKSTRLQDRLHSVLDILSVKSAEHLDAQRALHAESAFFRTKYESAQVSIGDLSLSLKAQMALVERLSDSKRSPTPTAAAKAVIGVQPDKQIEDLQRNLDIQTSLSIDLRRDNKALKKQVKKLTNADARAKALSEETSLLRQASAVSEANLTTQVRKLTEAEARARTFSEELSLLRQTSAVSGVSLAAKDTAIATHERTICDQAAIIATLTDDITKFTGKIAKLKEKAKFRRDRKIKELRSELRTQLSETEAKMAAEKTAAVNEAVANIRREHTEALKKLEDEFSRFRNQVGATTDIHNETVRKLKAELTSTKARLADSEHELEGFHIPPGII